MNRQIHALTISIGLLTALISSAGIAAEKKLTVLNDCTGVLATQNDSRALLRSDEFEQALRESVILSNPSSYSPVYLLGLGFFSSEAKVPNSDSLTDFHYEFRLYPYGTTSWQIEQAKSSQKALTATDLYRQNQLSRSQGSSVALVAPVKTSTEVALRQANAIAAAKTEAKKRALAVSDYEVLSRYFDGMLEGQNISSQTKQTWLSTVATDKKLLAAAREAYALTEGLPEAESVPLSTQGMNSYFQFIPTGQTELVSARILDFHVNSNSGATGTPKAYVLLVEWLDEPNDGTKRVRHVQTLNEFEVATIPPSETLNRYAIMQDFIDSLSLAELETLQFAKKLGIKVHSYQEERRLREGSSESDPLTEMSRVHPKGIRGFVERRWPNEIVKILTEEEKRTGDWHVIDVFSRIAPNYILKNFRDPYSQDVYDWVITQDGQLKISLRGDISTQAPFQLLRLGHGRGLFVGGNFTFNEFGGLRIKISAEGFWMHSHGYGDSMFLSGGNAQHVKEFVALAFYLQGRTPIESVHGQSTQSIFADLDPLFRNNATNWDTFYNGIANWRVDPPKSSRRKSSPSKFTKVVWDHGNPTDLPLGFHEWRKATGQPKISESDINLKNGKDWAFYVLKCNEDTSVHEIKKQYRNTIARINKLAQSGDWSSDKFTSDAMKVLVTAYQLLEKQFGH